MLNEEDLFNIITNNLAEELIASHFEDYFNLIMDFNNKAYDNGSEYVSSILNIRKKESSVLKAIKSLINFNVTELFGYSDRVYSKLKNQTFQGSTNTMERVNTNINNALSEGYRNGLGNKEIGKNLQKQFTGLKTHEATRIATTEVNSAQSLGAYEQYFIDDQEYHQWLAAGDDRTRLTHGELNGEIVKVGTPFSNGLLYPGDRNENIKEWINCRCTTVPWICPYNMMVPPGMVRFRESDLIPIPENESSDIIIENNKLPRIKAEELNEINILVDKSQSQKLGLLDRNKLLKLQEKAANSGISPKMSKQQLKELEKIKSKINLGTKLHSKEKNLLRISQGKPKPTPKPKVTPKPKPAPKPKPKIKNIHTRNGEKYIEYTDDGKYKLSSLNRKYSVKNIPQKEEEISNLYSNKIYKAINAYNRQTNKWEDILKSERITVDDIKAYNKFLDSLTSRSSLKENTILTRGESDLFINPKVGTKGKFDTFTSTSFDKDVATDFADEMYIYKIHAPKGTKGIYMNDKLSYVPSEREWLLPRGTKYEVIGYDKANKVIELLIIL